jgi:hypothetical protein
MRMAGSCVFAGADHVGPAGCDVAQIGHNNDGGARQDNHDVLALALSGGY